jgi:hypothetical protein
MKTAYTVIPDFFAEVDRLRQGVEAHFAEPHKQTTVAHQLWNYWFVPGTYTYLKTMPERVIEPEIVQRFVTRLSDVAFERWGLATVYWPYLSLYVAGCYQALHNDASAARLGYVYSLTRWDKRNFVGGETLLFREDGYFATGAIARPGATATFYDLVPANYNQLLVFDDRIPHAVPRLEGTMNPIEGRIVMHGHLGEAEWSVRGGLKAAEAAPVVDAALAAERARAPAGAYHGLLSVRLFVAPDGRVSEARPLLDRVMKLAPDPTIPPFDSAPVLARLRDLRLPPAAAASDITLPIAYGKKPGKG